MPRHIATGILRGADPIAIDRGRPGACLLLHGWITSPADFADLPRTLDLAGWDVHVPLHPGHGTTPRDLEGISADKLLEPVRERYHDLLARHDQVVLVGFSMGGTLATLLAAERPPHKLVLIAPFCGVRYRWYYLLPPRWWSAILSPVLRTVRVPKHMIGLNRAKARDSIVMYRSFPTDANRALFALRRRLLRHTDLSGMTAPTLLLYSLGDGTCSRGATEALFARLPASHKRKAIFVRSNHHILHDHDREQALAVIADFIGRP